ncbi:hypothetical protein NDU88_004934 [Pleurodeles waltl]|uniref:Secreted protein n=1 Tax=Pleurodeles waltl TaxID=8319 RepID=A0AAV7WTU0_PLEWA|nr:hypothetical protein NDU88_004934 [Pleurodeles waltl]
MSSEMHSPRVCLLLHPVSCWGARGWHCQEALPETLLECHRHPATPVSVSRLVVPCRGRQGAERSQGRERALCAPWGVRGVLCEALGVDEVVRGIGRHCTCTVQVRGTGARAQEKCLDWCRGHGQG